MTNRRLGFSWMTLGTTLGIVGLLVGACSKVEDDGDGDGSSSSKGGSGSSNTSATGSTGSGTKTSTAATSGGKTSSGTAAAGGSTGTSPNSATGNVPACQGFPTTPEAVGAGDDACSGVSVESEPLPVDMVILMDRSISNSYAIGTKSGAATDGTRRWDVLTAGMKALAESPDASTIGASISFFNLDGGGASDPNCVASNYETPVVPLGLLPETGPEIVAKMEALTPSGLTPTVPALEGTFRYAMKLKDADPVREKVVVMISDGFPTICPLRSPSDVVNVIEDAAAAPTPIRTFIIGVGDPNTVSNGKFNLINYASAGRTGAPTLLDESADAAGVTNQMVTALLNIAQEPMQCEFLVEPPQGTTIDPKRVALTYQPSVGKFQEIPKVGGLGDCASSEYGGWYFDNESKPTKVTVCPCTCSNFGAGAVNLVYGCQPIIPGLT